MGVDVSKIYSRKENIKDLGSFEPLDPLGQITHSFISSTHPALERHVRGSDSKCSFMGHWVCFLIQIVQHLIFYCLTSHNMKNLQRPFLQGLITALMALHCSTVLSINEYITTPWAGNEMFSLPKRHILPCTHMGLNIMKPKTHLWGTSKDVNK